MLAVLSTSGVAVSAQAALNDTGSRACRDAAGVPVASCAGTGQDGETGRDVTDADDGDGAAGFRFERVCQSGEAAGTGACPTLPTRGEAADDWGCTRDLVTGLLWEVKAASGPRGQAKLYTFLRPGTPGHARWDDAAGFLKRVNDAGLCGAAGDWRLPTPIELQSLMHYGQPATVSAIDGAYFPDTLPWAYWTARGEAGHGDRAWYGYFFLGIVGTDVRSEPYHLRLVRGPLQQNVPRFSARGDVVRDRRSALEWRRCLEGQTWQGGGCNGTAASPTWAEALVLARAAGAGGAGWRLPNVKELATLADRRLSQPAIDVGLFPTVGTGPSVWTSTPVSNADYAWIVQFDTGTVGYVNPGDTAQVRLVRDVAPAAVLAEPRAGQ